MITIITGKTKSGKTSKMVELYNQNHLGDGFVIPRVYKNNKLYGYEIIRLSSNAATPFKVHDSQYQFEGMYNKEFAGFRINGTVYDDVLKDIKVMIKNKISPIYLDGLGDLELLKKGFDSCLLTLLKSHSDFIISCPDTLVRKFILHYRLKDYKIIGIK